MRSLRHTQVGRKRTCVMLLAAGTILTTIILIFSPQDGQWRSSLPSYGKTELDLPKFHTLWEMEDRLPQHNLSLPSPEGKAGRYVKFSNQVYVLGWNNVLAESLLAAHLAWRAKRAYVFQDYRWNPEHYPWKPVQDIPLTPINALISGPMAGGSWGPSDNTPRAVSEKWFDVVCPNSEVKVIDAAVTKGPIRGKNALEVMEFWTKILTDTPDRCINIVAGEGDPHPQTFDLWTISTPKIIPIWKEFSNGPISRLLRTSPLVDSVVQNNERILFPPPTGSRNTVTRYETMLAVHLRRGDYMEACRNLANWNSTFFGWSTLPELPDPLLLGPPIGDSSLGQNTPENYQTFERRCLPSEGQLITRIRQVKAEWEQGSPNREKLSTLYIMTNAKRDWLNPLVAKLQEDGWETVATSKDLVFRNSEQLAVAMSADMEIARKAAVFLGNGWSSMTSNIVHQRLVGDHSYDSCRFL